MQMTPFAEGASSVIYSALVNADPEALGLNLPWGPGPSPNKNSDTKPQGTPQGGGDSASTTGGGGSSGAGTSRVRVVVKLARSKEGQIFEDVEVNRRVVSGAS